ncbi:MAG: TlyA family rRNA (cytidine-2'-O)-methyltransferase [Acidobacteria bacterium]|nr:TlyA family rRNA (cytidine-2'-O)-methyltransferase [Acidobacteriota bacterium]NIM60995.1 TlyA family rRNA (cytidine-2'-O)-methyltransferase [Acidobacteriota bacterium]NIO59963.1 TlyA family rRNA (cytidine-2'-O)-methyltransferase [Acidobacteriota bacterium]NIQ31035.1 TlyA family rRNA (cytidine-2'-O)-methyltransferase [Acidobacteriota bacterium]NIQ86163.1 TlyA family rRNA (cytidine-2'-O)-methyltransferase [Acidobacteriota bacterium]
MTRPRRARLDVLLVDRGLAPTRSKAQALVLAGEVFSQGQRLDKPGQLVDVSVELSVRAGRAWVGRGAQKIAPVLEAFGLDPQGRRVLDVGASTGGFTQLLLERGAAEVIALDVGRNQLDWKLRSDSRVHVLEGRNARHLVAGELPFVPDWAVIDVSFISLEKVLHPVVACVAPGGTIVALVKPQFEVGREHVGRKGLVRDLERHREVLVRLVRFVLRGGWSVRGIRPAGLKGAQGNQEYFVHIVKTPDQRPDWQAWIDVALERCGGDA